MEDRALYLEADEDITSAIDKLRGAPAGAVQIVVPKRSTLLQSVINLKLLKRAAEDSHRELVLVTTDKIAISLAGRIGLAVAPAVGAKAAKIEVPEPAAAVTAAEEVIEDETPPPPIPDEPVPTPKTEAKKLNRQIPPVLRQRKVADESTPPPAVDAAVAAVTGAAKDKGKSKTKVPNYGKLQKRMLWGGGVVVLIIGYFVAMYFATTAKVTMFVSAQSLNVSSDFAVDPTAASSDVASGTLAGKTVSATKTLTSTFQATGTQDEGTKASGTLTIKNCDSTSPVTIAAGTVFTSSGLNFTSNSDATIPPASVTLNHGTVSCSPGTGTDVVTATANGDQYNLGNATFTSPSLDSNYTITASQLSGGTTNIVKVVAQGDLTGAQTAALNNDKAAEQKALKGKLPSGYVLLSASFSQTPGTASASPGVGQSATSATLTLPLTYTELAVKQSDVEAFLKAQEQSQAGGSSQIYDDGFSRASYATDQKNTAGLAQFSATTIAYSGPKIDTTTLAGQLRGKRYGDAVELVTGLNGVSRAEVNIWPAWSSTLPHIARHITVKVSVAGDE